MQSIPGRRRDQGTRNMRAIQRLAGSKLEQVTLLLWIAAIPEAAHHPVDVEFCNYLMLQPG